VEFIELPKLKFFVATQAHPELKSRMEKPAPLFYGFVKACLKITYKRLLVNGVAVGNGNNHRQADLDRCGEAQNPDQGPSPAGL